MLPDIFLRSDTLVKQKADHLIYLVGSKQSHLRSQVRRVKAVYFTYFQPHHPF